ncbi:hypothetical protein FVQ98_13205 [Ottowia sp. GY511]|nr:hypothetical protein [Ottowia sp. GY511]TXK26877.1 hypothetical protein FVQ98_13205 [Ottowia sp. GY511]
MGTNVIYLGDLASASSVPAFRRARPRAAAAACATSATGPVCAPSPASWAAAAQRRAALRLASAPAADPAGASLPRQSVLPVDQVTAKPVGGRIGALRLTGRLIDVCAELERLAQAEALADAMARRA